MILSDNYVRLPPNGPNQNRQFLTKNEFSDRETGQSVLVQKSGNATDIVVTQKESDSIRHLQKSKDFQYKTGPMLTSFKHDTIEMGTVDAYTDSKKGDYIMRNYLPDN